MGVGLINAVNPVVNAIGKMLQAFITEKVGGAHFFRTSPFTASFPRQDFNTETRQMQGSIRASCK